ncbi:hypothetical protein PHLGIDRAFT_162143 [Phlebiopsis gigantea 11061_1 CR5-6]|uniref:Protein kinase domain-containing protein n=1 Tax=Phlebiopsis gigantea (strain 11061_1 CR5-6) TaxID=745531 RepID=A0A0C3RVG5_PHLG1|nr:hypothetical protein PHLGIDRAFT_162143 [Phlebiopsis gigantea 11061_1 CR5-6]
MSNQLDSATQTNSALRAKNTVSLKFRSYPCGNCNHVASRFECLIDLHHMISHAHKNVRRQPTNIRISTREHAVLPGPWDRIGRGIYEDTIQLLAKHTCANHGGKSALADHSFRTLRSLEPCEMNGISGHHEISLLKYITAQKDAVRTLTKLAEQLDCLDTKFCSALISDEDRIVDIFRDLHHNDRDSVLALRDKGARNFMDMIDLILRNDITLGAYTPSKISRAIAPSTRRALYRDAVRVAQRSLQLPTRIVLSNISIQPWDNYAAGSFGVVYKALHKGHDIAFKLLHDQPGPITRDNSRSQAFCKEAAILLYLKHPNICPLIGIYILEAPKGNKAGFVTPWISKGNVVEFLTKRRGGWEKPIVLKFIHEILLGLSYLHEMGIIHADLHPSNILVDDAEHIQLIDFGLSNFSNSTLITAGTLR